MNASTKSKSYETRRNIAAALRTVTDNAAHYGGSDFTVGDDAYVEATVLHDGLLVGAILKSTSNAGFGGIVGRFATYDSEGDDVVEFTTSLGNIDEWAAHSAETGESVCDTDECSACGEFAPMRGDDGEPYCVDHVGMGGSDEDDVEVGGEFYALGVPGLGTQRLTRADLLLYLADYVEQAQGGEDIPATWAELVDDIALYVAHSAALAADLD